MDYNKLLYLAEKNKQENIKNAQKKLYSTEPAAPKKDPKPQINLNSPLIQKFIAQRSSNNKKSLPLNAPVKSAKRPLECAAEPSVKPETSIPGDDKKPVVSSTSPLKVKKCKAAPPPLSYEEILKLAELKQKECASGRADKNAGSPDDHSSKSLERQLAEWRYRMHPPKKKLRAVTPKQTPTQPLPKSALNNTADKGAKRAVEKSVLHQKVPEKSLGSKVKMARPQPVTSLPSRLLPEKSNHPTPKATLSSHPKPKLKVEALARNSKIPSNHHILYCHKITDSTKPQVVSYNRDNKVTTSKPKVASVHSKTIKATNPSGIYTKNGFAPSSLAKSNGALQRSIPRHLLPAPGRMPDSAVRNSNYGREISESEIEEEEYESEVDSFVDDGDDLEKEYTDDYSKHIKDIFGYDKSRYGNERDDDIEETSFREQMKEEARSARIGKLEDLEDIRMEKQMLMRKMQKKPGLSRKF